MRWPSPLEPQLDAVMDEPLPLHTFADARRDEEVARPCSMTPARIRSSTCRAGSCLENDGLDPLEMQKMREHQSGRTGSDDSDLGTHGSWPRTRRSGLEEDGLVLALQADVEARTPRFPTRRAMRVWRASAGTRARIGSEAFAASSSK